MQEQGLFQIETVVRFLTHLRLHLSKPQSCKRTMIESAELRERMTFRARDKVWLSDRSTAFVKGWIIEEYEDGSLLVQCEGGSVSFRTFGV